MGSNSKRKGVYNNLCAKKWNMKNVLIMVTGWSRGSSNRKIQFNMKKGEKGK